MKRVIYLLPVFLILALLMGEAAAKDKVESSIICSGCHKQIFLTWSNSIHANSIREPIFNSSYMQAYFETKGKAKQICLKCHAPSAQINGDYDMETAISKEGVTCDFCHTMKSVSEKGGNFIPSMSSGNTKFGSLKGVSSPGHEVKYSDLHLSALLCATCHQYRNEKGLDVLNTYEEWKASPYNRKEAGKQCQDCHMSPVEGKIVPPEVKEIKEGYFNSHNVSGGHSVHQLEKAVSIAVKEIKREGSSVSVNLGVTNTGSGHAIPTGIPTRKVVFTLILKNDGKELFKREKIYERAVGSEDGTAMDRESDIFLKGAKVLSDNRIKPLETREETFNFTIPPEMPVSAYAKVEYFYRTATIQPIEMIVPMSDIQFPIDPVPQK